MSTLYRILVILFVAILIGGVFYGAVNASSSATGQPAGLQRPDGGGEGFTRPDQGDSGGGIQFPMESFKNFAIIAIVCAGYLAAVKIKGKNSPFLKLLS